MRPAEFERALGVRLVAITGPGDVALPGRRDAADQLAITENGHLVLIEWKRVADAEHAVGQLLRYWAAIRRAPRGWLERMFRASRGDRLLKSRLADADDPHGFWRRAEDNVRVGAGILVIACDRADDNLRRLAASFDEDALVGAVRSWPPIRVIHAAGAVTLHRTRDEARQAAPAAVERSRVDAGARALARPSERRLAVTVLVEEGRSSAWIAHRYGRTERTIQRDVAALRARGLLAEPAVPVPPKTCRTCGRAGVGSPCDECAARLRRAVYLRAENRELSDSAMAALLDRRDRDRLIITDELVRRERGQLRELALIDSRAPAARTHDDATITLLAQRGVPFTAIAEIIGDSRGHVYSRVRALRAAGVPIPYRTTDPRRVEKAFVRLERAESAFLHAAPADRRRLHRQVIHARSRVRAALALSSSNANRIRAVLAFRPETAPRIASLIGDTPAHADVALRRLRRQGEVAVIAKDDRGRNVWGLGRDAQEARAA